MKNSLLMMALVLILSSCAKEEFSTNKGVQSGTVNQLGSSSAQLCAQSTLISPKVDILMLWDNSSSFNFVTSATKSSMSGLISSVSEKFDYHIVTAPLIPVSNANLFETQLVVKNNNGLTSDALNIVKSKDAAVSGLGFTQTNNGSAEAGVDRAINVIQNNRNNGIFREGAYTMIVVISNEDDKGCSLQSATNPTGYNCSNSTDYENYLAPRVNKLLCIRGSTTEACSGINPLNSSMMRFINISPLTSCVAKSGSSVVNQIYKRMAKKVYDAGYTNGWPPANDHLNPDLAGAPDSYNLCTIDFAHIFDGVNTAIKQTLLKHKYDYWPVAGENTTLDPDTIRVVRSDGKILMNRKGNPGVADGYELITDSNGDPMNVNQYTRFYPTPGEPFKGKMIKLYGSDGDDKIVYPDCLTVTYNDMKLTYGYYYLTTEPKVETVKLYRSINGGAATLIPQDATNGWSYYGYSATSQLDANLRIVNMDPGAPNGYFIRLNGSYQFQNEANKKTTLTIEFLSKNQ